MPETIEPGDRFEDSIFGETLLVKYVDEEIVLLMGEDEHHHVYSREGFDTASERTLMRTENRFTKVTNDDE